MKMDSAIDHEEHNLNDSASELGWDRGKAELDEFCAVEGLDLVVAREDQLLVDIDEPNATLSWNVKRTVGHLFKGKIMTKTSRSGNTHLYIDLINATDVKERILLQMICGSDPIRERLNYKRVVNNIEYPIVFFESKETK